MHPFDIDCVQVLLAWIIGSGPVIGFILKPFINRHILKTRYQPAGNANWVINMEELNK